MWETIEIVIAFIVFLICFAVALFGVINYLQGQIKVERTAREAAMKEEMTARQNDIKEVACRLVPIEGRHQSCRIDEVNHCLPLLKSEVAVLKNRHDNLASDMLELKDSLKELHVKFDKYFRREN